MIVAIGYFIIKSRLTTKEMHYHAGFQIYVNGQRQDYSDFRFMNLEPCSQDQKHDEDGQMEKAHLHDNVGDVVHVHSQGALWFDLFKNIKVSFDLRLSITAYVNGQLVEHIFERAIQPYDSVVIFVGSVDVTKLSDAVTKEHIIQVEQKSESCGK